MFSPRWRLILLSLSYAGAVLTSAFLVFQVQLLLSKSILPWFGGTPAVWTTSMVFFQVVLFAGYAYAHASIAWLEPRVQGMFHLALVAGACLLLPVVPGAEWKPRGDEAPVAHILGLLATCVGLPFFALAATGPLLQAWFARTHVGQSPYRLYALSNVGSLLGLVSYPFLVEPSLAIPAQSQAWSLGFSLFAALVGYCALHVYLTRDARKTPDGAADSAVQSIAAAAAPATSDAAPVLVLPTARTKLLWLLLPALASLLLLATTNHICQDVATIPFLWVVPLTLYLLSFIVCFEKESWYSRRWCATLAAGFSTAACALFLTSGAVHLAVELPVCLGALFFGCMVCHGELIRRKPAPALLTKFYLLCSAGGALGGTLVAVVAPLVFPGYVEYPLGLLTLYLVAAAVIWREFGWRGQGAARSRWQLALAGALVFAFTPILRCQGEGWGRGVRVASRGFYGVLSVVDVDQNDPHRCGRALRYGRIMHGFQFLDATRRRIPTLYYAENTGIGQTLRLTEGDQGRNLGFVGLGVGALAAYGQPTDRIRIYEINPDVVRLAENEFTFLSDCPSQVEVVLGDARQSLEREPGQEFDVLALDAFSGDAIPTHLLTREAFLLYLRHLRANGVLALHISNRHLDLAPLVNQLARENQLQVVHVASGEDLTQAAVAADWVLLTRNEEFLKQPAIEQHWVRGSGNLAGIRVWTDEYSNLLQVLR